MRKYILLVILILYSTNYFGQNKWEEKNAELGMRLNEKLILDD